MSIALRYTASKAAGNSVLAKAIASFQGNLTALWNKNNTSCAVRKNTRSFPHLAITTSPFAAPITVNSYIHKLDATMTNDAIVTHEGSGAEAPFDFSTWLISTLKRRKKKMNKHKLQKRRKLLRAKNKK
jgi:hypothetical protein